MGYFDKFNAGAGVPFMDGATKFNVRNIVGETVHLCDYGFIEGEKGEFIVMAFREYPSCFAFGNSIMTGDIREMEQDFGSKDAVLEVLAKVAITFEFKTSKKNREYIAPHFEEETA